MTPFEIEECLESMVVLVDRREQPTDKAKRRYKAFGVPYRHCTLDFGDYTYNFTLPTKQMLYEADLVEKGRIFPQVAIERKMNLDELASCFINRKSQKNRDRFQREFERAKEHGAKLYILIENASWENLMHGKYRSQYNPKAFLASITAWMARYNAVPIMCKEETSGKLIKEILYRELKERLQNDSFGFEGTDSGN